MCGVAGIIAQGRDDLAQELLDMLWVVRHRGMDATGVAVFERRDGIGLRATLQNPSLEAELEAIITPRATIKERSLYQGEGVFTYYDAVLGMDAGRMGELHKAIDAHPGLCVHSIGASLTVYKDKGTAHDILARHAIKSRPATHGIGHVRLATESAENINAAHPFSSHTWPDLAIVHNGQFTNYFNMRRMLERQGVQFKTQNDSEMAAHYLGWRMSKNGGDLEAALADGLEAFDGIFTILACTPNTLGVVKDVLGIKPMLCFSRGGVTVFGSEQISLMGVFPDAFADELDPGTVRTWSV